MLPEAQQVEPVQPWPPHWAYLATQLVPGAEEVGLEDVVVEVRVEVVTVLDLVEVETLLVLDETEDEEPGLPLLGGALKVEPMGPNLMLE